MCNILQYNIAFPLLLLPSITTWRSRNEPKERKQLNRVHQSEESGEKKERTTTLQKITLPIFEKKTIQTAKHWWRRFIQYVKMTQFIDLNTITTDKETIEEYRDKLEKKQKTFSIGH